MIESGIIFFVFIVGVAMLVIWLIRSEKEDLGVDEKLKLYGSSKIFQKYYTDNAYKKASTVVRGFERKFPKEAEKLNRLKKRRQNDFNKNRDRYNYLIFKYNEELQMLRDTGAKYFTRQDISKYFDVKTINDLVDSHVINFYDNTFMLHDKYTAYHPFERDSEGNPIKIEI